MNTTGTKIELQYPLTVDGQAMTTLYVRRAKVKDLLALKSQGDDTADGLAMMAKLTGVNQPELEELDMIDYRAVMRVVGVFLGLTPAS
ncbi:MAG: phage tail assembly protein [Desulfobulbaceae bacterium]|jgi:hypothetical protein|nr:phage tail assembly protein [Desulfobulbaceae bacterium]